MVLIIVIITGKDLLLLKISPTTPKAAHFLKHRACRKKSWIMVDDRCVNSQRSAEYGNVEADRRTEASVYRCDGVGKFSPC